MLGAMSNFVQKERTIQTANERVRKLTSELDTLNKELESFSYAVSHDLRAPLRAISSFSNIVQEDFAAQLPAQAQAHLQKITVYTRKVSEMIEHLLAFSRLMRQPLSKQRVDLSALVPGIIADLRKEQSERAIQIELGPLPDCCGDPVLLKQAWLNLLANAFKFTRPKQPARIEVGSRQEGAETVYFIKDNGVGFDAAKTSPGAGLTPRRRV